MNSPVLYFALLVIAQVLAFLFASIRLSRAMPDTMVGPSGLPEIVSTQVEKFRREAGRGRSILAAVLCLAAVLTVLTLPLEPSQRKHGLAVISLISTAALVVGYAHDYRKVLTFSRQLPEPPVRVASLSPRSLRAFYSPLWETLPLGIFGATIVFTVWFAQSPSFLAGGGSTLGSGSLMLANPRLWIQPLIGAVLLPGLFALSLYTAVIRGCLTPQSKAHHSSPDAAIDCDQRLRRLEMRNGLVSRVGIALLLLVVQARTILALRGREVPGWTGLVLLLLTVVLLASFVRYSIQINRVMRPAPPPPGSALGQR